MFCSSPSLALGRLSASLSWSRGDQSSVGGVVNLMLCTGAEKPKAYRCVICLNNSLSDAWCDGEHVRKPESFTLKTEVTCYSKTFLLARETRRHHFSDDSILHCYRRENTKSCNIYMWFELAHDPSNYCNVCVFLYLSLSLTHTTHTHTRYLSFRTLDENDDLRLRCKGFWFTHGNQARKSSATEGRDCLWYSLQIWQNLPWCNRHATSRAAPWA
jgi:hypothetical protein